MRNAVAAGAATRLHFAREKGNARLTSRTPLAPDQKRHGTAKSHAGPRAPVPPARRTATRTAENAIPQTGGAAKKPQIPAYGEKNRPRGSEPENPQNATTNAPPDVKLHEIQNAEKAVTTTGRAARRPQIPAFREENGPPDTQPENFENGDHNSPPDEKSQKNRNAEKAVTTTGRAAKRPQIAALREKNGPPDTQPENFEGGDHNAPPDQKSQQIRNAENAIRELQPAPGSAQQSRRDAATVGGYYTTRKYYIRRTPYCP